MQSTTGLPSPRNLNVPENERYALREVIEHITTPGLSDTNKIAALKKYFQKDYRYSLNFLGKEE